MPCITIQSKKRGHKIDIAAFSYSLSQQLGIDIKRINILIDYFDESSIFLGSTQDHLIITLSISETNEEEFIKHLVKTTAAVAEKFFRTKEKSTAVICNLVKERHLFINDQFK